MSQIIRKSIREYFLFAAQIVLIFCVFLVFDAVYRWDSLRADASPKTILLTGFILLALFAALSLLLSFPVFLLSVGLVRLRKPLRHIWLGGLRFIILSFLTIQHFNFIIDWSKRVFPIYQIGRNGRLLAFALLIGVIGIEWIIWRLIRRGRVGAIDTSRRCTIIIFTFSLFAVAAVALHIILENHSLLLKWFHAYGAVVFVVYLVVYWRIIVRLLDAARLFLIPAAGISFLAIASAIIFFTFMRSQDTVYTKIKWDASRADPRVKNIIFLTFDALAANRMSLYGNPRLTTPNLDALGRTSYVFDNMHAESDATVQSLSAISTGVHTYSRKMHEYGLSVLRENIIGYVPTALKQIGWSPVYLLGAPNIGDRTIFSYIATYNDAPRMIKEWFYGNPIQFFITRLVVRYPTLQSNWIGALYQDYFHKYIGRLFPLDPFKAVESTRPGDDKYRAMQEYLTTYKTKPAYFRAHFYPPHQPYHRIPPYKGKFLDDPRSYAEIFGEMIWNGPPLDVSFSGNAEKLKLMYEEYLLAVDAAFGEFIQFLKDSRLFDQTMIIVSADHGHAFEKGDLFHLSKVMYEQTVRIPLIIHMPGQEEGKRIATFASHVDIMPTIFETLGIEKAPWMEGESLWPYMRSENTLSTATKFSQAIPPAFQLVDRQFYRDLYTFVAYKDPYKLIYRFYGNYFAEEVDPPSEARPFFGRYPRLELFNLRQDPNELSNLIDRLPQVRDELMGALNKQLEKVRQFRKSIK